MMEIPNLSISYKINLHFLFGAGDANYFELMVDKILIEFIKLMRFYE